MYYENLGEQLSSLIIVGLGNVSQNHYIFNIQIVYGVASIKITRKI